MTEYSGYSQENQVTMGLGWLPDLPDVRDFGMEKDSVSEKLKRMGQKRSIKGMLDDLGLKDVQGLQLKSSVDLRRWCSKVEDQGRIGSCTAQAGAGLIEYYVKRACGEEADFSRLFLYKVTRNLLGWQGDTGAFLRTTMAAMRLLGAPPERYWPYDISKFDEEPSKFAYSIAKEFQSTQYFRLDTPKVPTDVLLQRIKAMLAAKMPMMFGFSVYSSIRYAKGGKIPYPGPSDTHRGGHAVVAVGYDDTIEIEHPFYLHKPTPRSRKKVPYKTKGALLIRNSWGTGWGDGGYGWLPYKYVEDGLAVDWWCLIKNEWIDTEMFGISSAND